MRNCAERNDCPLSRYGDFRSRTEGEGAILIVPYLIYPLLCVRVVSTHMPFPELLSFFFCFLFSFIFSFNTGHVEHSSVTKKNRAKGLGDVISKEVRT